MALEIRLARLEDLTDYTELLQRTYQFAYTNKSIGLTEDCFSKKVFATKNSQDYLRSHLDNSTSQKTWLAISDSTLIGSITCIIIKEAEAELTGFYVLPKHQGKGLGKKLFELALDFAENRDMLLDIYTHNERTIETYMKWGFELDTSRGEGGYFTRHWPEWPAGLEAKCMYMRLNR